MMKSAFRRTPKRDKKMQMIIDSVAKKMGQWSTADDYLLIVSLIHCSDINLVHKLVTFSSRFSLSDIRDRWYCILRDETISRIIIRRVQKIPAVAIRYLLGLVPFNRNEERILATVPSDSSPVLADFDNLKRLNSDVFLFSRSARQLYNYWKLMKKHLLLDDQEGYCRLRSVFECDLLKQEKYSKAFQHFSSGSSHANESSCTDDVKTKSIEDLLREKDDNTIHAITLENELIYASQLLSLRTGIHSDFGPDIFAVLEDQHGIKYRVLSEKVTFGRKTEEVDVDIDLCISGGGQEVSRFQGFIQFDSEGDVPRFYICNTGKRPFYVNGTPVLQGEKSRLANFSFIEVLQRTFPPILRQSPKKDISGLITFKKSVPAETD